MTRFLGSRGVAFAAILFGIVLPAAGVAREATENAPDTVGHIWQSVRIGRERVLKLRPPEALEMFVAILGGSQLGPGEGWFHPGETRYGWKWLAARYDDNQDGKLTLVELPSGFTLLRRLDRNQDEVLTDEDFDWSAQSPYVKQAGIPGMWFRKADADSNGKLSRAEWEALFQAASKAKGFITPADLRDVFPLDPPKRPAPSSGASSGPSTQTLLAGLLSGEIGCLSEGPRLNHAAPDFTLSTQDGKRAISLADFRGKKPVVLIFGSFT